MNRDDKRVSVEKLALCSPYPVEAFEFVQQGLEYTVKKLNRRSGCRHVSGRELCYGLRDFAVEKWGFLARAVLSKWNINSTMDFGRIVYLLIKGGWMVKDENDSIEDFDNVFDFEEAFCDTAIFFLGKKRDFDSV